MNLWSEYFGAVGSHLACDNALTHICSLLIVGVDDIYGEFLIIIIYKILERRHSIPFFQFLEQVPPQK